MQNRDHCAQGSCDSFTHQAAGFFCSAVSIAVSFHRRGSSRAFGENRRHASFFRTRCPFIFWNKTVLTAWSYLCAPVPPVGIRHGPLLELSITIWNAHARSDRDRALLPRARLSYWLWDNDYRQMLSDLKLSPTINRMYLKSRCVRSVSINTQKFRGNQKVFRAWYTIHIINFCFFRGINEAAVTVEQCELKNQLTNTLFSLCC